MSHDAYIAGLRELIEWLELNPHLPRPPARVDVWNAHTKEEAAAVMLAMGDCKKDYGTDMFYLTKEFGEVSIRYVFSREAVCTKRVVGTRHIEAQFYPARDEEIVEWECHPILEREAA